MSKVHISFNSFPAIAPFFISPPFNYLYYLSDIYPIFHFNRFAPTNWTHQNYFSPTSAPPANRTFISWIHFKPLSLEIPCPPGEWLQKPKSRDRQPGSVLSLAGPPRISIFSPIRLDPLNQCNTSFSDFIGQQNRRFNYNFTWFSRIRYCELLVLSPC